MLQDGFASVVLLVIVIVIAVLGGIFLFQRREYSDEQRFFAQDAVDPSSSSVPDNLSLPFDVADISFDSGIVNPLGVIRGEQDNEQGHGGIDFPLYKDSNILAVADGEVVRIKFASDPWGGMGIYQLLESSEDGEGWAFLYEHVTPVVEIGSKIKQGDIIATKTPPNDFTAHFQLTFLFNNFEFTRDSQCWPELLGTAEKNDLDNFWDKYKNIDRVVGAWGHIEGFNEVQLCYPMNTDARVPL